MKDVIGFVLSIGVVFISIFAALKHQQEVTGLKNVGLLDGLRRTRDAITPKAEQANIALGYNVCLDAVVNALELLGSANVDPPDVKDLKDFDVIESLDHLAKTFKLHFTKAAGGERPVSDQGTFKIIEDALYKTNHRNLLGGNAAIMAVVLANDYGFQNIILGGQVGKEIEKLLPSQIETIGLDSGKVVKLDKDEVTVRDDEVHIIMEYAKGSSWGDGKKATRANRFIISRDMSNAVLASLEPLNDHVIASKKRFDLLVVAGLHMLDVISESGKTERLKSIVSSLTEIPRKTKIHFELASMGDDNLLKQLAAQVLPIVDSLGLNEQEMAALYEAMDLKAGVDMKHVARTIPKVGPACTVLEAVMEAVDRLRKNAGGSSRSLSRIHFHSFSFHILVQKVGANDIWPNIASAVAAGSVKASERACNSTELDEHHIALQMPTEITLPNGTKMALNQHHPVLEWITESGLHFALAPVLTCNHPKQTVGLGDSISASALAYQVLK